MIKAVIFDIDGVIFNRDKAELESLQKIYNYQNISEYATFDSFLLCWKKANKKLWEECSDKKIEAEKVLFLRWFNTLELLSIPVTIESALNLTHIYTELYCHPQYGVKKIIDIINKLHKKNVFMGVITNGVKRIQHKKLERLSLEKQLSFVVTDQESKFRKPDKRMFLYTLDYIGMQASEILYIGNSLTEDIYPATSLGINTIWFDCNGRTDQTKFSDVYTSTISISDIFNLI